MTRLADLTSLQACTTVMLNNVTIGGAAPGIQSLAALARPAAAAASPLVLKSFTATNGVLVGTFEADGRAADADYRPALPSAA